MILYNEEIDYLKCDPYIYFNRVRPYIHGWKNNPALPQGLIYTGVNYFQFNGIYNELINSGLQPDAIQILLQTGRYNPEILNQVSEAK